MSNTNERRKKVEEVIFKRFLNFYNQHEHDDEIIDLDIYLDDALRSGCEWSIEKLKIILEILKMKSPESTKEKILSYLKQSEYGWQGNNYHLHNSCFRFGDYRCKKNRMIDNSPEITENIFADIDQIFFHREYGAITTYLFSYALAALFSSKLKINNLRVPYLLQIACERNSNLYNLIHEIIDICDVNVGITNCCELEAGSRGYCECEHMTIFPVQSPDKALNDLMYNRDVAVAVDGYDSERCYLSLLREVVNVPGRVKDLDIKDRFNVLPIFICSAITSRYRNVFSMDLTGMDIDTEYLNVIQNNRKWLASWAFELIKTAGERQFSRDNSERMHLAEWNERPFFNKINRHIEVIRKECRAYVNLSQKDIVNIGLLSYFWSCYMEIFRTSIGLSYDTEFMYKGKCVKDNRMDIINEIKNKAIKSLIALHDTNSPQASKTVDFGTDLNDSIKSKQIKKKGEQYAKDIIGYYQSYGVSINILPGAEYKDDRYVFPIKLLPGTDGKLIGRYIDEVRRLLGVEFLFPDISASSMKLIASEKPLKENSLIKILESQKFKESKAEIPYAVGYDMMGEMVIADVAEFPHLLIGGTTNSGKSSAIHSLLMSIVCKQPADKVKLLLFDFGASRLSMFEDVPHMLIPGKTIRDAAEGQQCILKLQEEMEHRLEILDFVDNRNYEKQLRKWASIVCVIDEFPAFVRQSKEKKDKGKLSAVIEDLLARARKVKIHLILSAQDTTRGGIDIKNTNLAAGIAFRCTSWHNSNVIIGDTAAVNLSGKGAMYFKSEQYEGLKRLQGSYMPPEEIIDLLDTTDFGDCNIGGECDEVRFDIDALKKDAQSEVDPIDYIPEGEKDDEEQPLVEIVEWIWNSKRENISNKQLKDNFKMGYPKANIFLGLLEERGIVSAQRKGTKLGRTVNLDNAEEFLKGYGCLSDDKESDLPQILDGDNAEPIPKENMDTTVASVDTKEETDDNPVDFSPQLEREHELKSKPYFSKHRSDRYKYGKRSAR